MSLRQIITHLEDGGLSITAAQQSNRRDQIIRLTKGILFTAKFVVIYQAILVGVVLFFAVWHAYEKVSVSRRAARLAAPAPHEVDRGEGIDSKAIFPRQKRPGSSPSSSGSSTLEGNVTPPEPIKDMPDDRTPLLHITKHSTTHPAYLLRLRSLLMYQPPPLPFFNKTLPENTTTLLILLLLGLNIFYILYNIQWETSMMFIWSDRTALCFAANLPWLYLLGAKNQPLRLLTGYSYEHLNILHRRLGEWLCFVALLHSGSMFVVWYDFFRPDGFTLWWFLKEKTVYLGLITLACYELLYATSLASFRKWWYELFLGLHVVLQTGALGFLYFHHRGAKVYVAVTLAIFLIDRMVYRLVLKTRTFKADLEVLEDGQTLTVSANWPLPRTAPLTTIWTFLFGHNMRLGWDPSEHVFLTVPALGSKHHIQAHPFTIASAAPTESSSHAWFTLTIRALDGFTRDLLIHAQTHATVSVRLDGPYGAPHALDTLRASDAAIVVAGGSGIAVAYPMLWALLHAPSSFGDPERAAARKQKVCLIWIVHQASHLSWLGRERLEELEMMGLRLVLPAPTAEAGRPDVGSLVRARVGELAGARDRVGVVVSGPDGVNRAARNACSGLAWEGRDVRCCVEKFGW